MGAVVVVVLVAQVGVLFMTFVMGLGFGGAPWAVAMAQAAVAMGVVVWGASRKRAWTPAVPVVSLALTFGLHAVSNTIAFGCSDRVLAAFEHLPPPEGATFEMFVGGETQDCMAEVRGQVTGPEVFAHYRNEFKNQGWSITRDSQGILRGARDGMFVELYNAEGTVYFILEEL